MFLTSKSLRRTVRLSPTLRIPTASISEFLVALCSYTMYNPKAMRALHVTDMHLCQPGDKLFGIDLSANYQRILEFTREERPDMIICTGDLSCTERNTRYIESVLSELSGVAETVLVCPGNHDEVSTLASLVSGVLDADIRWPFADSEKGFRFLVLDTADGVFGDENRQFVLEQMHIADRRNEHAVILMHHPPREMGARYLDSQVALADVRETRDFFAAMCSEFTILCGHYHMAAETKLGKGTVIMTAAVSFGADPDSFIPRAKDVLPCARRLIFDEETRQVSSEHLVIAD